MTLWLSRSSGKPIELDWIGRFRVLSTSMSIETFAGRRCRDMVFVELATMGELREFIEALRTIQLDRRGWQPDQVLLSCSSDGNLDCEIYDDYRE